MGETLIGWTCLSPKQWQACWSSISTSTRLFIQHSSHHHNDSSKKNSTQSACSFNQSGHICFWHFPSLQMFPALSTPPPTKDWSGVSVVSELTSGVILRTISHVMEHFQEQMRKLPEVCKSSFRRRVKFDSWIRKQTSYHLKTKTATVAVSSFLMLR